MADSFDPYLRWLGIRDPQRPPNHYRLLGVDLFENDGDVIAVAADRQMAHVRTFQAGQLAELSQQLLNELAAARICLLKPEKKAGYDAQLKKQLGGVAVAGRPKPQPAATASLPVATRIVAATSDELPGVGNRVAVEEEFPDFASLASATSSNGRAASSATSRSSSKRSALAVRKKKSLAPWIGLAVAGVLLVIAVVVVQSMNETADVATKDGSNVRPPVTTKAIAPASKAAPSSPEIKGQGSGGREQQSGGTAQEASGSDRDNVATPSSGAEAPASQSSPPEPPVHTPRDVALVDNPAQHDSSDKSESLDKSGSPIKIEPPTPIKTAPIKTTTLKPAQESPARPDLPAVPDKEAQAAAEKTIQSIYRSDLDQSNHGGPEAKAALAKQLMARGIETADNPAARYVLLTKARDLAVAGGDVSVASGAVKKLLELYGMDRADEQLFLCFTALTKTVRTRTAAESLRIIAGRSADSAIADDNYDLAGKYARLAMGIATKLRDPLAASQLKAELAEIEQCKKEYAKVADMLTRLRADPDDSEANLAIGRFFGFVKGDFGKALPYLANASDASLSDLAKKELSAPADPAEQVKIGDLWWALGESNHELSKSHVQAHAAEWYSKALPNLKGLSKGEVEARIREVEASNQPRLIAVDRASLVRILLGDWKIHFDPNPDAPKGHIEQSGFDYMQRFNQDGTWTNQITSGTWSLEGDTVTCIHNNRKDLVQKYQITGNGLRGESYSPPEVLLCHGAGTKVEPGR